MPHGTKQMDDMGRGKGWANSGLESFTMMRLSNAKDHHSISRWEAAWSNFEISNFEPTPCET